MTLRPSRSAGSPWFPALALLVVSIPAVAQTDDVLHLRTGSEIRGEITSEDASNYTIRFSGGSLIVPKGMVERVVRTTERVPDVRRAALQGLSRLAEREDFGFIRYRGRIVGHRLLRVTKDVRRDIAGYVIVDKHVYPGEGADPACETEEIVFASAELKPIEFTFRRASGPSVTILEGTITGPELSLRERAGGRETHTRTFWSRDADLWSTLRARLATDDAGDLPDSIKVFRPATGRFEEIAVSSELRRVTLGARTLDARVFRVAGSDGRTREIWLDAAGIPVREEVGAGRTVVEAAPRERVLDWARGGPAPGATADDLVFASDSDGFRIERPDPTWEFLPGEAPGRPVLSLAQPTLRASVDVFSVPASKLGGNAESALLEILERMRRVSRGFERGTVEEGSLGGAPALVFTGRAEKNEIPVRTLGVVSLAGERAWVLLCASPVADFAKATPGFRRILDSFQAGATASGPDGTQAFEEAAALESGLGGGAPRIPSDILRRVAALVP